MNLFYQRKITSGERQYQEAGSMVGLLKTCVILSFAIPCHMGASDWHPIGPWGNFGVYETHGRVRSIHVQAVLGDHYVYIGTEGGGIWRTRGSVGPAWESIGENLPNPSVGAFAVHPLNPSDILVGSGDYARYAGAGMFHTTNAGQSWTTLDLPCAPTAFFRVHYLLGNSNTLVAATDCGVLRSTTGPNGPWTIVLSGLISDLILHPGNANIQFCAKATSGAGNDGGIYRSTDGGQTWTLLTSTGTPANNFGLARIAICRDQPNTMAFVHERGCNISDNGMSGVRKSVNGGATWENITGPIDLGQACHVMAIAIRPNNPNQIYVGANQLYSTQDGGQNWLSWDNSVMRHQDQTQFLFSSVTGDNMMWYCNDGGVYLYFPTLHLSESWNGSATGNLSISTVADMDARGPVRAVGLQDDGAAISGNRGSTWTGYDCCDVYHIAVTDPASPAAWFVGGGGTLFNQSLSGPSQNVGDTVAGVSRLKFEPFSRRVFGLLTDQNGLISVVSRPASATTPGLWSRELTSLPMGIGELALDPLDGQTFYLLANAPQPGLLTVVRKSGGAWNVVRTVTIGGATGPDNYLVSTATLSPDRRGEGWAGLVTRQGTTQLGGRQKILHTTDDWQSWSELASLPAPAGHVTGIAVSPVNTRQIYVATDIGVYASQDGGGTWASFQSGLPNATYCTGLRYVEGQSPNSSDALVLATWGRGMYERILPSPGVVYVDQRNNSGAELGTREHPFNTLGEGLTATPTNGVMALNGAVIYQSPPTLTKPMTITAYEFPARLTR